MFGLHGDFKYTQCGACGSLSQSECEYDLSRYYPPEYYSFSAERRFPLKARAACFVGRLLPTPMIKAAGQISYSIGVVARVRAEIASWLEEPRRRPRLLDVGCGAGAGLLCYHYAGCRVEGLDPFYGGANPAEFTIHRVPLAELHGCYDVITFNHSLEHMPNPQRILENVLSLLAEDGVCVIKLPKLPSAAFDTYGECWFPLDAPRHYFIPSVRGLTHLAETVGFKRVGATDEHVDQSFFWSEAYRRGNVRHGAKIEAILSVAERDALRKSAAIAHARQQSCHGIFVLHKD